MIDNIYNFSSFLNSIYPKHKKWFYEKMIPGVYKENRNIFFIQDKNKNILALSAVKKDDNEKKICLIYDSPELRGKSIGSKLVEKSMQFLETDKPFITFSENKKSMFEGLIKKYKWQLFEEVPNIYTSNSKELCYNGYLTEKSLEKLQ